MISFDIGKLEQSIDIQQRVGTDAAFRDEVSDILLKYVRGDWGDTPYDIWTANDRNAAAGGAIAAQYILSDGTSICVYTNASHDTTTMRVRE